MPIVSIIVPVYNVEDYLRRCVDSILNQTFDDFELILVNDGSPDRSGEICDEYAEKDDRVRVIHQENGGSSVARNNGLQQAKGEYLFFVDSDDVIHPQTLQVLYQNLVENDVSLSMAAFERFEGETAPVRDFENQSCFLKTNLDVIDMLFDERNQQYALTSACCKLYRRELFDEIRFPEGRLFEDQAITYQLFFRANQIAVTDSVFYYYYRNTQGNMGTLSLQKRFDEYDAQWERLSFFATHKLEALYDKALMEFLRTAQWDLIQSRKGEDIVDPKRKIAFETQYETVFDLALARGILDFHRDYDYFVLAKPKKVLWWRIKRLLTKRKS